MTAPPPPSPWLRGYHFRVLILWGPSCAGPWLGKLVASASSPVAGRAGRSSRRPISEAARIQIVGPGDIPPRRNRHHRRRRPHGRFRRSENSQSDSAGEPDEAVDQTKQERLSRLALAYLKRHGLLDIRPDSTSCRSFGPSSSAALKSNTSKTPSKPPAAARCLAKIRGQHLAAQAPRRG